jgi:acetylornithine aminotransferase
MRAVPYGEPTLTLVRGDGATVWDDAGNAYVDLVAGIAVNALGHAHPAVVEAVSRQVRRSATRQTWSPTSPRCASPSGCSP